MAPEAETASSSNGRTSPEQRPKEVVSRKTRAKNAPDTDEGMSAGSNDNRTDRSAPHPTITASADHEHDGQHAILRDFGTIQERRSSGLRHTSGPVKSTESGRGEPHRADVRRQEDQPAKQSADSSKAFPAPGTSRSDRVSHFSGQSCPAKSTTGSLNSELPYLGSAVRLKGGH
ncbi:hypothetical protein AC578_5003 [Pseudocercospora eumusae]|uniref:Uncharacterized protein n=1 Tax=Pseudocercospora eumusae TaxID=321146 RepID=A0A139H939_9PEZI|nr:hypothetical protein AC578_5003 [Pseudocercospora eumusae]